MIFLEERLMNQLNSLILEGNLVRDAEMIEPAEGFKICKFTIAVNRWYRNKVSVNSSLNYSTHSPRILKGVISMFQGSSLFQSSAV